MMSEPKWQPGLGANIQGVPKDKGSLMYRKDRLPWISVPSPALSILAPDSHAC